MVLQHVPKARPTSSAAAAHLLTSHTQASTSAHLPATATRHCLQRLGKPRTDLCSPPAPWPSAYPALHSWPAYPTLSAPALMSSPHSVLLLRTRLPRAPAALARVLSCRCPASAHTHAGGGLGCEMRAATGQATAPGKGGEGQAGRLLRCGSKLLLVCVHSGALRPTPDQPQPPTPAQPPRHPGPPFTSSSLSSATSGPMDGLSASYSVALWKPAPCVRRWRGTHMQHSHSSHTCKNTIMRIMRRLQTPRRPAAGEDWVGTSPPAPTCTHPSTHPPALPMAKHANLRVDLSGSVQRSMSGCRMPCRSSAP